MKDQELVRSMRQLNRSVRMLQTELRLDHLDEDLLTSIDAQMERGIGNEPRCTGLRDLVDSLRENLISARHGHYDDAVRSCEKLMDAVELITERIA